MCPELREVQQVRVDFEGRCYTVHWITHGALLILLHPELSRGGRVVRRGSNLDNMAHRMVVDALTHLKSIGRLHHVLSTALDAR